MRRVAGSAVISERAPSASPGRHPNRAAALADTPGWNSLILMKTTLRTSTRTRQATRKSASKAGVKKITRVAGTRPLTRKRDIFSTAGGTSGVRQSGRSATSAIP